MDDSVLILLGLAVLAAIVLGIGLGVGAWIKVLRLERTIEAMRAGGGVPLAPVPTPAVAAVPVAAAAVSAAPGVAAAAAPTSPAAATASPAAASSASRPSLANFEAVVAGRWLNRVGLVAVAIAMSFFLKYAIDNDWIGPMGQVALGLLIGAGLVVGGPAIAKKGYRFFADGLMGLGAAILYLSIWAAGSYYTLCSTTVEFGGMVAVTLAMIAIAIGRDSPRVALLALVGGFVTPALVSTGQDAYVALFSYLAVLDAALLVTVWRRGWHRLEWPAFLFTQLYVWVWYGDHFHPDARFAALGFVALFFAEFVAVPVIQARKTGTIGTSEMLLVMINAGAALLAASAFLWPDYRWTLAAFTLGVAAAHLIAAAGSNAPAATARQAKVVFGGVALTVASAAIPLRLDGDHITMAWAIEAAVLIVVGLRTRLAPMRGLGWVLLAIVMLRSFAWTPDFGLSVFNTDALTDAIVLAALMASLLACRRSADALTRAEATLLPFFSVATNLLAIVAITREITIYFHQPSTLGTAWPPGEQLAISLAWSIYAAALLVIGARQHVAALRWQGLVLLGATTLKVFFVDLSDLSGFARIASSMALGVVLLIVSFLYQRKLTAGKPESK
jgi:uncharacterized membrane protein